MDGLSFYGRTFASRLLLGTSQYPSPAVLSEAVRASGAEIVTVSLRREGARVREGQDFWRLVRDLGVAVLPNTAGCHSAREAVTTAQMAREIFDTPWIKLEVIGEADTLQPDVFGLVEAARILTAEGFEVFPYTTEDLVVAERLLEAGCKVLMPWGAPIGSGQGLNNTFGLRAMRAHFPDVPLVVDAGIGLPSHAAAAMELGYDAVLLNTAVAKAGDPVAWRALSRAASRAGARRFSASPCRRATWRPPRRPCSARRSSHDARSILPHRGQRRLGAASRRRRRAADPASHQRSRYGEIAHEARAALALCRGVGAQLVVNDYWRVALDIGADYVHLGQEDLDDADPPALRRAGVRLGVSTHDLSELDRALALAPDYVALGPIYPTKLKAMRFGPQGLDKIGEWKARVGKIPLVAIGGLTVERGVACLKAGADVVSVVTDITLHADPEARTRQWVEATRT